METNKKFKSGENLSISWHPAFVEAVQLELKAYKDALEFIPEYQLTSEPLRIDCVIIKKTKDVEIKKNIAAIFKTWNLFEYKSPDDYVSMADFYKVYGYACLYASFNKVPINDMTITFIESHYPGKLLEHLKNERNYTVEENRKGIYIIRGDILPIQIVDSRRLSAEENLWLKNLSNRLDTEEFRQIRDEASRQDKSVRIAAYLDAIIRANIRTMEEVIKMDGVPKSLEKVLKDAGLIAKWETSGKTEIAKNMVNRGYAFEEITSITQLDPEKVKALYQNQ